MRRLFACLILFLVLPAARPALAGERYSFSLERTGGLIAYQTRGHVVTEGAGYRAELEPVLEAELFHPFLVSADGGAHEKAFDPARRTYYEVMDPTMPSFSLLTLTQMGLAFKRSAEDVQLSLTPAAEPEETPDGRVRRHDLRLSYRVQLRIQKDVVRGRVQVETAYWMAEDRTLGVPRFLRPRLVTSFAEIDGRLAKVLAGLKGVALRQETTARAQIDDGGEQVETIKVAFRDIRTTAVAPELFEVPAGFRYEKPEVIAPGLETPPFQAPPATPPG